MRYVPLADGSEIVCSSGIRSQNTFGEESPMPIIEPGDQSIRRLTGIHLWHDDLSSCSQRVRTTLAHKGRSWESHLLEIPKGDNTTAKYLSINPKGLVPALVHDGVLMTESMDIIDYLDRTFADPPLRPDAPELVHRMKHWMKMADEAQYALKVLSHEFLFRAVRKISKADLAVFEKNVENEVLVDFIRIYQRGEMLPEEMITECVDHTDQGFHELDAALQSKRWLVGENLSLADIAWMPNIHRMELMDWPLDRYPNLVAWHDNVKSLDCYRTGIVQWEPQPAREMLTSYALTRGNEGHHVRNFGRLALQYPGS
jgi:glutathione S-transferase